MSFKGGFRVSGLDKPFSGLVYPTKAEGDLCQLSDKTGDVVHGALEQRLTRRAVGNGYFSKPYKTLLIPTKPYSFLLQPNPTKTLLHPQTC